MREFYLNLPSNTNKALGAHRVNSTSEYRVKLPQGIHLNGAWEVALVEVQYPYSWDNVPNDDEENMLTNQFDIHFPDKVVHLYVTPGHYDNPDHILAEMFLALKVKKMEGFSVSYSRLQRRVEIQLNKGTLMVLSKHLAYMLGFKSNYLNAKLNKAQYPPDLRGGIDSLFVYSDIVQPQVVGDSMQPLLRILPVGGRYGEIIHRVFVAPHYIDVLQKDFSSISISIKTDRDLPVPFKFGKSIVKLHFRRK